jgi:hypothetical protein
MTMLVIFTGLWLLFVNVVVFVDVVPIWTLPKDRESGEKETSTPVPDSGTTCAMAKAGLVIVSAPVFDPELVGEKVTETLQIAPALMVVQVSDFENSPVVTIEEMVNGNVPVFCNETTRDVLVVLIN